MHDHVLLENYRNYRMNSGGEQGSVQDDARVGGEGLGCDGGKGMPAKTYLTTQYNGDISSSDLHFTKPFHYMYCTIYHSA
jgi:hypothetical protein